MNTHLKDILGAVPSTLNPLDFFFSAARSPGAAQGGGAASEGLRCCWRSRHEDDPQRRSGRSRMSVASMCLTMQTFQKLVMWLSSQRKWFLFDFWCWFHLLFGKVCFREESCGNVVEATGAWWSLLRPCLIREYGSCMLLGITFHYWRWAGSIPFCIEQ